MSVNVKTNVLQIHTDWKPELTLSLASRLVFFLKMNLTMPLFIRPAKDRSAWKHASNCEGRKVRGDHGEILCTMVMG